MEITQIFSQANASVEIEFRAMERSLRATGCDVPLRVIPYDDTFFDLPRNAEWLPLNGVLSKLNECAKHPCHLRYAVLTHSNFQYADVDIIFLQNPAEVLAKHSGFVATCTQWQLPHFAVNPASLDLFRSQSSTWKLKVFNSGQFACENALYTPEGLMNALAQPNYESVFFLPDPPWDQPGFNLLVHQAAPEFTNITLPPDSGHSTWAGDYAENFEELWSAYNSKPYLIHFAGGCLYSDHPINKLFMDFLTKEEQEDFLQKRRRHSELQTRIYREGLSKLGRLSFDFKQLMKRISPNLVSRAQNWRRNVAR